MPKDAKDVKTQVEAINLELERVHQSLRDGTLASHEGPFPLGDTTEAAAYDWLRHRSENRVQAGYTHIGLVDGVQMVRVWLFGDPSMVHELLAARIKTMWWNSLVAEGELHDPEFQARFIAWRQLHTQLEPRGSPLVRLYDRHGGPFYGNKRRPGVVGKEPDIYWALKQDWSGSWVKGRGTAVVEVVWKNESERVAVWEGLLWSGLGKRPGHRVALPHNTLVLFADDRPGASQSHRPAFIATTFAAADHEGCGKIAVYTMDATQWLINRWKSALQEYEEDLHDSVEWHEDVEAVNLTHGFFGPPSNEEQAWQNEPFPLSKASLQKMCEDAMESEQVNARMLQPLPSN